MRFLLTLSYPMTSPVNKSTGPKLNNRHVAIRRRLEVFPDFRKSHHSRLQKVESRRTMGDQHDLIPAPGQTSHHQSNCRKTDLIDRDFLSTPCSTSRGFTQFDSPGKFSGQSGFRQSYTPLKMPRVNCHTFRCRVESYLTPNCHPSN